MHSQTIVDVDLKAQQYFWRWKTAKNRGFRRLHWQDGISIDHQNEYYVKRFMKKKKTIYTAFFIGQQTIVNCWKISWNHLTLFLFSYFVNLTIFFLAVSKFKKNHWFHEIFSFVIVWWSTTCSRRKAFCKLVLLWPGGIGTALLLILQFSKLLLLFSDIDLVNMMLTQNDHSILSDFGINSCRRKLGSHFTSVYASGREANFT